MLLKKLKEIDIIEKGGVALKHAGVSDTYVDIKKAYGHPKVLKVIVEELWKIIDKEANCITTSGIGGIPPASAISHNYGLNLTIIREEQKVHGIDKIIEGYLPNKDDKIIVFDDVLTTGSSLKYMIEILEQTEAEILGCYVVVKRGEVDLEVPIYHLTTLDELIG